MDDADVALEDVPCLIDFFLVFLFRLCTDARGLAVADVVLKTYLEFALLDILGTEQEVAGSDRVKFAYQVKHVLHGRHARVRTEVLPLFRKVLARIDDTWKALVENAYVREGLIVFQEDVVLRLVLLDEVVLHQQRIELRFGDGIFDRCDFRYEL